VANSLQSWIAESIYKTLNYKGIIRPLTPLIITPLFSDTDPKQAVALIEEDARDLPPPAAVTEMDLPVAYSFRYPYQSGNFHV
jgi:hypothetical protein